MTLRLAVTALALAVASQNALAADMTEPVIMDVPEIEISEDRGGAYIAARLGAAFANDTDFDLTVVTTNIANEYQDISAVGALAIGYSFGRTFSAELEVGYSEQDIESHTLAAIPATISDPDAFGTTRITYGLINAAAAIDTGTIFRPYLSAGLGLAEVDFDAHGVNLAGAVGPLGPGAVTAMDDSDTGVAWQVGAGALIDVTDRITFEAGYRYFAVSNVELSAVDGTVSDVDVSQHQALFGLRYNF